ncbi:MAG TPA: hypothetical protein VIO84_14885 [Candidatus Dormibacteraeota bacterium]
MGNLAAWRSAAICWALRPPAFSPWKLIGQLPGHLLPIRVQVMESASWWVTLKAPASACSGS